MPYRPDFGHTPPSPPSGRPTTFSVVYGALVGRFEEKRRRIALSRAALAPDDKVLEVAVGPGLMLIAQGRTWGERLYQALPKFSIPYVTGGCRPVLMREAVADAGFVDVRREFVQNVVPSEIISACKPVK